MTDLLTATSTQRDKACHRRGMVLQVRRTVRGALITAAAEYTRSQLPVGTIQQALDQFCMCKVTASPPTTLRARRASVTIIAAAAAAFSILYICHLCSLIMPCTALLPDTNLRVLRGPRPLFQIWTGGPGKWLKMCGLAVDRVRNTATLPSVLKGAPIATC